jgi:hypothetical protein
LIFQSLFIGKQLARSLPLFSCCFSLFVDYRYSFGKLGLLWNINLSRSLEEAILNQASHLLTRKESDIDIMCLSSILEGLMRLEYDWKNDGKLEKAIYHGITKLDHSTIKKRDKASYGKELVECLSSLGEIAKRIKEEDSAITLPKEVLDSFYEGIHQCSTSLAYVDVFRILCG